MKQQILLLALSVLFSRQAFPQSGIFNPFIEIEYEYDDSGNRTIREMKTIILSPPENEELPILRDQLETDSLQNCTVKLSPNPTPGQLSIVIEDYVVESPISLIVADRNGVILQQHQLVSNTYNLDLSTYPPSWYIVAFVQGEIRREFKIIKY